MDTEYKPLFNRTYLKVLMVGCVFAVIWLSSLGKPESRPQGQIESRAVYWLEADESDIADQLVLIFPTSSAFSDDEQDRQQWRGQILTERLQQQLGGHYDYQVQVADDYLRASIHSNEQTLPKLAALLNELARPVDTGLWRPQLKQIQARRYLQQQSPEQQLLSRLRNQLGSRGKLPLAWDELFNQPRLILVGEDAESRAEQLAAQLPKQSVGTDYRSLQPTLTGRATLELSSDQSLLLLANTLPGRTDSDFVSQRLIAATSQLALSSYRPASDSQYHLQWKSLQGGGYQAVVFFSSLPLNSSQLDAFRDKIDAKLVEQARIQLQQRWQQISNTADSQLAALSLIARYQLPLNSLSDYLHQLGGLENERIAAATRKRFDPQQQYSLRIDNQP